MRSRKKGFVNLIGKKVEVVSHSNDSLVGFSGIILYESENLIELRLDSGKIVKIPKNDVILKVFYNDGKSYKIFSYGDIKGSIVRRLIRL